MTRKYKTIDLEHHYETELFLKEYGRMGFKTSDESTLKTWKGNPEILPVHSNLPFFPGENLDEIMLNLGEERISKMDKAGVDFAQISLLSPQVLNFLMACLRVTLRAIQIMCWLQWQKNIPTDLVAV